MKKIFIHVGPGKTGSSALQAWFNSNQSFLAKNGIYYPKHDIGPGEISSGNLQVILTYTNDKWSVDKNKISQLIDDFESSDFKVLLLSSEHFYSEVKQLSELIPSATFIYYLRHPLSIIESNYNQGVKRHGFTQKLLLNRGNLSQLRRLGNIINIIGAQRINIRAYEHAIAKQGGIVKDFLELLNLRTEVTIKKINPSYCIEALEFKRLLNHFEIANNQDTVDQVLQSYRKGTESYSLIPIDTFEETKQFNLEQLSVFIKDYSQPQLKPLLGLYENLKQKPFYEQSISSEQINKIWSYIKEENPKLFSSLKKNIQTQVHYKLDNPNFYEVAGVTQNVLHIEPVQAFLPEHLPLTQDNKVELFLCLSKMHEERGDLENASYYTSAALNLQQENVNLYNRFAYLYSLIEQQSLSAKLINKLRHLF